MIRWKLLFDGEGITLLIAKDVNLLRGVFLVGEVSKFLAVGWDSPLSPGFPIKVYGDNVGFNPAGHCFVLRDLVPMTFSNKAWFENWKCAPQAKRFIKFVSKSY